MHAKPDLRVFLEWMIAGSGSVITDVITFESVLVEQDVDVCLRLKCACG